MYRNRPSIIMSPVMDAPRVGNLRAVPGPAYPTFRSYVVQTGVQAGLGVADMGKIQAALRASMGGTGTCASCSGAV